MQQVSYTLIAYRSLSSNGTENWGQLCYVPPNDLNQRWLTIVHGSRKASHMACTLKPHVSHGVFP